MKIYRGESIRNGRQQRLQTLRTVLREGFPADFINGGNPYLISQLGVFDAVTAHVATNFAFGGVLQKKHFISFSSDRNVAEKYARTQNPSSDPDADARIYHDYTSSIISGNYDSTIFDHSEHLIATLDLDSMVPVQKGFDYGFIVTQDNGSKYLALDAEKYFKLQIGRLGPKYLQQLPNLTTAYNNAQTDKEWLVLSLDLIPPQNSVPASSSGLIKHGNTLSVEFYVNHEWLENTSTATFMS